MVLSPSRASLLAARRIHTTCPRAATSQSKRTVAVLGGGISGLTSAYRLSQQLPPSNYNVLLLESSPRLGGWIHSERTSVPHSSDSTALIEAGPRSIRPTGPTAMVMLELLSSLGLIDRMLKVPKTAPSAKNRFIYYPDRLAKLPNSLASLFTAILQLPFLRAIIPRVLLEPRVPSRFARPVSESKSEKARLQSRESLEDESVDSFVSRRFGPSLAANLVSAVIHGIYAGDSRKLSVRSVLPFLWESERVHGSVLRSMLLPSGRNKRYRPLPAGEAARKQEIEDETKALQERLGNELVTSLKGVSVYSFPNGLQEIVSSLEKALDAADNVTVCKGTAVDSILIDENHTISLRTSGGETIPVDRLVSSVPAARLSKMLPEQTLPYLDHNPSANVGVVNIVISRPPGSSSKPLLPVQGFGYLIPRTTPNNQDGILGVVFDSDSLPTQDLPDPLASADSANLSNQPIKLTVMMGGSHWEKLSPDSLPSKSEMSERAIRAVSKHLSIPRSLLEDSQYTKILPSLQRDCIPQYLVGHPVRMAALHRALSQHPSLSDKLTLVGASYTGVSLNDCVAYATQTANKLAAAELSKDVHAVVTGLEHFQPPISEASTVSARSSALSGTAKRMVASTSAQAAHVRALHTSARRRNQVAGSGSKPNAPDAAAQKPTKPLGKILADSIRASGPMPVSTYMRTCLLDPMQGYYSSANAEGDESREVLGSRGDFITSPEISQVFGELCAIFYVARWQSCGEPAQTRLIELGPGKGTLIADMLRTFATFPKMLDTIKTIHLVETSEGLIKLQLQAISDTLRKAGKKLVPADQAELGPDEIRIEWFPGAADVPLEPTSWTMLTAHEFFDALPTHIFQKTTDGWREVLVGLSNSGTAEQAAVKVLKPGEIDKPADPDELGFVLSPTPTPWTQLLVANNQRFKGLQPGQRVEVSPEVWAVARRVGELVSGQAAGTRDEKPVPVESVGGAGLVIDYGGDKAYGSSFRAFHRHKLVDVFHRPGESDLTANVDFLHLKSAVASTAAQYAGPLDQAHFLTALGLAPRLQSLQRTSPDRADAIASAANRLVDPSGMGSQYTAMAIYSPAFAKKDDQSTPEPLPSHPVYPFEM